MDKTIYQLFWAFYHKKTEASYGSSLLEVTALAFAVTTFHPYLSNSHFRVFSYNLALTYLNNLKNGPSKFLRYSLLLANYNVTLDHIRGSENVVADALSPREYPP